MVALRFLYFGDMHYRETAPENRIDNFVETQERKTAEIIQIGKDYKVSAFLQPGDLFDIPNPSTEFVSKIVRMWRDSNLQDITARMIEGTLTKDEVIDAIEGYAPLIGIVGNHELFGRNLKILPKTAISLMQSMGLIQFATKENPIIFKAEDGLTVAITGTHYHLDIDKAGHLDDYVVEEKLGDYHIHLVHGMLSDKSMGSKITHTLVEHIAHTKADLTITGHDHIGFPLTEIDGKYFVNPGAPIRLSNDVKEMNRQPKVLLIDITKANGLQLKEIPLKSAEKGDVVLSREKIIARKKRESSIEEYKKAVRDAGKKKTTDIVEIIAELADSKDFPPELKQDLIDRISEKKATMDGEKPSVNEAYIEKAVFENFQSHEYTELNFSKGLNIFIGESRQGKTAILRGFHWVYENKPTGKRIIRKGADYARVTLFLSNGYIISRYIEAKDNGKNGYEITDPTTGETTFHNTKILPEVQSLLGYSPFVIDEDLKFNLNFQKQGDSWFLIGDNYSSSVKAKMIGAIYGTQHADAVLRDLDSEERKVNEQIKLMDKEVELFNERIKKYDYLEDVEKTIQVVEKLVLEIENLKERYNQIYTKHQKYNKLKSEIDENKAIVKSLNHIPELKIELEKIKVQAEKERQLKTLYQKYLTYQTKIKNNHEIRHALRHLDEAKALFQEVKEQVNKKEQIEKYYKKYQELLLQKQQEMTVIQNTENINQLKKLQSELQKLMKDYENQSQQYEKAVKLTKQKEQHERHIRMLSDILMQTEAINKVRELMNHVKTARERQEKIQSLYQRYTEQQSVLLSLSKEAEQHKEEKERLLEQYQTLLSEVGTCPVCYGTIDQITIKRIIAEYQEEEKGVEV